ncbi:MAG: hypothetical protein GX643_15970 [Acidimicrobiales bacterium]|nr:hypothetical protein [Acidimicrobiales bacterium]
MTLAHRTPRIDLTGSCLLGADRPAPGVDVVVIDLEGVGAAEVTALVAAAEADHVGGIGVQGGTPPAVGAALAAGVGLVVLDVASTPAAEVRAVVEAGVVAVLHHPDPALAVGAVDALAAAGVDTGRVVVEVGPDPQIVEEVTVLERTAYGFRVGAVLGPVAGRPHAGGAADGWEIGTIFALLSHGVALVRGVDPERFRRVATVLGQIDGASRAPVASEAVPASTVVEAQA